jgi:hypothetical protein
MNIHWAVRKIPLRPVALAARGDTARQVALRLLQRDDDALGQLEGVTGPGFLAVRGEEEHLPWADGIVYLGAETTSPLLLLPTTAEPSLPVPLLELALRRERPQLTLPIAFLPEEKLLFSFSAARPIVRASLLRWLESSP